MKAFWFGVDWQAIDPPPRSLHAQQLPVPMEIIVLQGSFVGCLGVQVPLVHESLPLGLGCQHKFLPYIPFRLQSSSKNNQG